MADIPCVSRKKRTTSRSRVAYRSGGQNPEKISVTALGGSRAQPPSAGGAHSRLCSFQWTLWQSSGTRFIRTAEAHEPPCPPRAGHIRRRTRDASTRAAEHAGDASARRRGVATRKTTRSGARRGASHLDENSKAALPRQIRLACYATVPP